VFAADNRASQSGHFVSSLSFVRAVVTLRHFAGWTMFWWLDKKGRINTRKRSAKLEKSFEDVSVPHVLGRVTFLTRVYGWIVWGARSVANYWGGTARRTAALITWLV